MRRVRVSEISLVCPTRFPVCGNEEEEDSPSVRLFMLMSGFSSSAMAVDFNLVSEEAYNGTRRHSRSRIFCLSKV